MENVGFNPLLRLPFCLFGILAMLSPSNPTFFVAKDVLNLPAVPQEDVVALPPFPQEIHDFLQQCAAKLTPKCDEQIKEGIYNNGKVSDECCKRLVDAGPTCHDDF